MVHLPVPAAILAEQCYNARYKQEQPAVAPEHVHATALALLQAAQSLESDPEAQKIQQSNQNADGDSARRYFLKRNYAGEGI